MAFIGPRSILAGSMVILSSLLFVQTAESCTSCRAYFDGLRNKTQGGCRCIYYEVYSTSHPHVIADCNNLKEIPKFSAICNVSDVYTVNLQNNQIRQVDQYAFKPLEMSEAVLNWAGARPELILLRNRINFIHREAFKGGMESKLSLLDLRYNELTSIPEAVFTLVNLTKLYLKNNSIKSVHGDPRLKKLRTLDLTSNKLTAISPRVCNFPRLSYLYLDGNPIEHDLSLDLLYKCEHLQELTWPKPSVTCNQSAIETYANSTRCKITVIRHGDNRPVMCDSDSSAEFKGIPFEWAIRKELSKVCTNISKASALQASSISSCLISLFILIRLVVLIN